MEITRLPEQPRPKKRGSGTTREKAQSRLREYVPGEGAAQPGNGVDGAGHWKALSRSHQEIGEEIGQLLGMSKEQFCQVVLLPQGDFARFLRADAEARARLLGRLFDTRRFAALEEQLNARRKSAADRVAAGDEQLLALAHRMAQAAGECADLADPSVPAPASAAQPAPARGRAGATAGRATVPGQGGPAGRAAHRGPAAAAEPAAGQPGTPGPSEPGFAEAVLVRAAVARAGARERLDIARAAVSAAEEAERDAAKWLEEARGTRPPATAARRRPQARRPARRRQRGAGADPPQTGAGPRGRRGRPRPRVARRRPERAGRRAA